MSDKNRRISKYYLKMLHSLFDLYKMLKVQLPPQTIRLESNMSALGIFFEDFVEIPDADLSSFTTSRLRTLRLKCEELGRLIFGVGMNDTDMVGDFMSGRSEELKEKINQLTVLRKELYREMYKETISKEAIKHIKNDDAKVIWHQCYGNNAHVSVDSFHSKMMEIYGGPIPCSVQQFKVFFGGDTVSPKQFGAFVDMTNANYVYAANDKVLLGSGHSITDYIVVQRRLGHLHAPFHRQQQEPEQQQPQPGQQKQKQRSKEKRAPRGRSQDERNENIKRNLVKMWVDHPEEEVMTSEWEPQPKTDRWTWVRSKVKKWINLAAELSKYFHGKMERKEAEELLHLDTPGTFLLRYDEDNNICVSFVHVVPYKQDNSWKEQLMRKHIVLHLVLNYKYRDSQPEPITWEEGLVHRRNVSRHRAFREFQTFLAACGAAESELLIYEDP
ncbi:uncharacterized protein [Ptychodera flava]|uniref:uncharacterized protein n=1 Tax=Ptychodera flava TaxID=63121 RepID=UPI003969D4C4